MKTIGVIGGMSWESSLEYYRLINEAVKARLGGLHSAEILLYSLDFQPVEELQDKGDWDMLAQVMAGAAVRLEKGGAEVVLIASNTMHKLAPEVERAVDIPLLHIADAAALAVEAQGLKQIGLLGTRFTMEQDFYRQRLASRGIEAIIPEPIDRALVHRVIYQELCLGKVESESRSQFLRIIEALAGRGAQGIVLGCTEIPLLIHQEDVDIPVFDTTRLHAEMAVDWALRP
ncbi:MAG: aspartate/glutamate racemase family protein [Bacillota bacterium]